MAVQIFDEFLKEFEQPITQFVSTSVQNLASTWIHRCERPATLYVVLYGISILRGTIREPIMGFAWRSMRLVGHRRPRHERLDLSDLRDGAVLRIAPERDWQCDSRLWPRTSKSGASLRQAPEQGH